MVVNIAGMDLYTVEDLAQQLNIKERTVRKMLKEGKLKGRKLARRWHVTGESLREYFGSKSESSSIGMEVGK